MAISLTLNGKPRSADVAPDTPLLWLVRDVVGPTGTKYGCGVAQCGGESEFGGDSAQGTVKALDPMTGKVRWSFPLHSPPWAGLLSTGGGLVFGGTNEGVFFALSPATGRPLWHFQTGAMINANPMAFALASRQYLGSAAGSTLQVFTLAGAGAVR